MNIKEYWEKFVEWGNGNLWGMKIFYWLAIGVVLLIALIWALFFTKKKRLV